MRRIWSALMFGTALVGVASAVAVAKGSKPVVQLRQTKIGKILVNSRGFTVYAFTKDGRNSDKCVKIKNCVTTWPLLTTSGKPVGGPGIKSSLLGTITVNGKKQVTYAGHPLYTYVGDSSPGQTSYVNVSQFGGRWPALNASGNEVT